MITGLTRFLLAIQLIFGGQARITPSFTPSIHTLAMAKSQGYFEWLPFIPGNTPKIHTKNIGYLMLSSGIGMLVSPFLGNVGKAVSILSAMVGTGLAMMGVYAQKRMGIPYWLPCVNTALGLIVLYSRLG